MQPSPPIQAYSTPTRPASSALPKAAIGVGIAGVALLCLGGLAALNQRFSFIPLNPLYQRLSLFIPLTAGGVAVAFSGGTLIYNAFKSKQREPIENQPEATSEAPAFHTQDPALSELPPAASHASPSKDAPLPQDDAPPPQESPAPPASTPHATIKLNDQRERRLVLDPAKVQASIAKNLRLAYESQQKERPINNAPKSFMFPEETIGFDTKLTQSELEKLKGENLVPPYEDVVITRNSPHQCYFAMSPLHKEGRMQIGVAHTKGLRQHMEDRHISSANLMLPFPSGSEHAIMTGIFDGHGGDGFANYLADNLPRLFLNQFEELKTKSSDRDVIIYNALKQAIVNAGRECDRNHFLLAGTTVACTLIIEDMIYIANLGNSRTIYLPFWPDPIQLSDDAKETPRFTKRIIARGGQVKNHAVGGKIKSFGACGDLALKTENNILFMPQRAQITTHKIASGGTIVIASNGLWDVATTGEAAKVVAELRGRTEANRMALNLVKRAFLAKSQDNITAIVIQVG